MNKEYLIYINTNQLESADKNYFYYKYFYYFIHTILLQYYV
jgi:hypothetical protein